MMSIWISGPGLTGRYEREVDDADHARDDRQDRRRVVVLVRHAGLAVPSCHEAGFEAAPELGVRRLARVYPLRREPPLTERQVVGRRALTPRLERIDVCELLRHRLRPEALVASRQLPKQPLVLGNGRPPAGRADRRQAFDERRDRREEVVADGAAADVLLGKLAKDISFALRRGTIAQVTTHHHALDGCAWLRGYAWPARARPPRMRSSSLPSTDKRRAGGLGTLSLCDDKGEWQSWWIGR